MPDDDYSIHNVPIVREWLKQEMKRAGEDEQRAVDRLCGPEFDPRPIPVALPGEPVIVTVIVTDIDEDSFTVTRTRTRNLQVDY